jgi:Ca2+:H+ antiporter
LSTRRGGEEVIARKAESLRPNGGERIAPAGSGRAGPSRHLTSRIFGFLRAEGPFMLAALSIVLLELVAANPEIGPVGHFGFLTEIVLLYVFGVVVFAALGVVRHAELLAVKYGEPYGTLILTIAAVTVEVVMLTTMIMHGENNPTLARDTIFATVMILMNGLIGLCLLVGGMRYGEQRYNVKSSKAFLTMLFALTGLALILPDTLTPRQEPGLEVFLVFASLLLYGFFLHVQTRKHVYFFTFHAVEGAHPDAEHGHHPAAGEIRGAYHAVMLLLTIVVISVLVEYLSVALDDTIEVLHLSPQLPALIVAIIITSPESLTAIRASLRNDMQRMINIALGSALSTIALTIPVVLTISYLVGRPIILGLTPVQAGLMIISLLVAGITEADGSTSALEGLVQVVLFSAFMVVVLV